eukprot:CAMPEP_0184648348 /NCGR_PEP_ID=MMETSP0308-20130426/5450_1 /TAXON_ID=38269 /ORGANISM="Gloeochaete witrockiana, Strain SAG 46.84" /LENGTH=445 /DNA_ID=CAMNT_0027080099 /DNA_START=97 /DNA_END=1434 /DNA_ORIENTATION=+
MGQHKTYWRQKEIESTPPSSPPHTSDSESQPKQERKPRVKRSPNVPKTAVVSARVGRSPMVPKVLAHVNASAVALDPLDDDMSSDDPELSSSSEPCNPSSRRRSPSAPKSKRLSTRRSPAVPKILVSATSMPPIASLDPPPLDTLHEACEHSGTECMSPQQSGHVNGGGGGGTSPGRGHHAVQHMEWRPISERKAKTPPQTQNASSGRQQLKRRSPAVPTVLYAPPDDALLPQPLQPLKKEQDQHSSSSSRPRPHHRPRRSPAVPTTLSGPPISLLNLTTQPPTNTTTQEDGSPLHPPIRSAPPSPGPVTASVPPRPRSAPSTPLSFPHEEEEEEESSTQPRARWGDDPPKLIDDKALSRRQRPARAHSRRREKAPVATYVWRPKQSPLKLGPAAFHPIAATSSTSSDSAGPQATPTPHPTLLEMAVEGVVAGASVENPAPGPSS